MKPTHSRFSLFFLAMLVLAAPGACAAPSLADACYAPTKPLTPSLRAAFVGEVRALSAKAEKDHGVPAAMFAAMAINESGYGTTQLAIAANNVLSYKWNSNIGPSGRKVFKLACQPKEDAGNTYVVFKNRADSADFVAARLATSPHYKAATDAYRSAVMAGQDRKAAAVAWIRAIAPVYNPYESEKYIAALLRIADDPIKQSGQLDDKDNLWLPAATQEHPQAAAPKHDAHVVAVSKAQKSAYARTDATNGCPAPAADVLGWPAALVRECIYRNNGLTAYVALLEVKPETIATWIENGCSRVLPAYGKCFETVLECARLNSGMMFPITGNLLEDGNYFFRNGVTSRIAGWKNGAKVQIPLERQKELAFKSNAEIASLPTGLTRFWRTLPAHMAARYPAETIPRHVDTRQWLEFTQAEMLAALERPNNRLLEAYLSAHPTTLAAGNCPK